MAEAWVVRGIDIGHSQEGYAQSQSNPDSDSVMPVDLDHTEITPLDDCVENVHMISLQRTHPPTWTISHQLRTRLKHHPSNNRECASLLDKNMYE